MASQRFGRSLLARQIDAVLQGRRSSCSAVVPLGDSSGWKTTTCLPVSKPILCAGFAFLVLDPGVASAVSLGELKVDSSLGERLSAAVPVTIRGGELLTRDCVTLFEQSGNELQNLRNPELKVPTTERPGTYSIRISTRQPLFEPMYEFAIRVHCRGTPLLMKHYVLMLDLPGMPAPQPRQTTQESGDASGPTVSEPLMQAQQPRVQSAPADRIDSARTSAPAASTDSAPVVAPPETVVSQVTPVFAPPETVVSQVTAERIPLGVDYRVRPGDRLSSIAERVEGRPVGSTWDVADWIHAANPKAFVDGNPDLIKRGSMIRIPAPGYWETGTNTAADRKVAITPDSNIAATPLSASTGKIEPGVFYRVSSGDCLSNIAERVEGRPVGSVWDVADWIYEANPDAFVGGNPDLIKLGSMIRIPSPGYWESGTIQAADRKSAVASAAVQAAAVRAESPDDQISEVVTPAPVQTETAQEIDTGVSVSLPPDVTQSPTAIAATPEPPPTAETELIEDFALSADPGPAEKESVFTEQDNNFAVAAPTSAADDAAAFDDTAAQIAAFRRQLAEAREVAAAARQTSLDNQAIAATQNVSTSSSEVNQRRINPLLAISLGLLFGLALSSLLLRNRLTEFVDRLRGRSTAATEDPMANRYDEPEQFEGPGMEDPPPAYESAPSDITELDELPTVSSEPPAPSLELEIPESIELPTVSPEPSVPSQLTVDEAPANQPTPDTPDDKGITDPDPTGTMSELFGIDVPDSLSDAEPEIAREMELTHELTLKGLSGHNTKPPSEPDAAPENPTELELTQELATEALPVPDAPPAIAGDMEPPHELTIDDMIKPDPTPEQPNAMDVTSKHTVQELSELVDPEDDDDGILSATLSEALGLLEQDYEDEFEASQIIDKPKLDPSFLDDDDETLLAPELRKQKEES